MKSCLLNWEYAVKALCTQVFLVKDEGSFQIDALIIIISSFEYCATEFLIMPVMTLENSMSLKNIHSWSDQIIIQQSKCSPLAWIYPRISQTFNMKTLQTQLLFLILTIPFMSLSCNSVRLCILKLLIMTLWFQVDPSRDPGQFAEVGSSVSSSGSKSVSRSHPDPVSSHILDTSLGRPAAGVMVTMYRMGGEQAWTKLMARWDF